jgi:hypothetical protein
LVPEIRIGWAQQQRSSGALGGDDSDPGSLKKSVKLEKSVAIET